tara:strand:- start:403 stop:672 length:270 start_codon:yes stop_codon:yes gene_type:complete
MLYLTWDYPFRDSLERLLMSTGPMNKKSLMKVGDLVAPIGAADRGSIECGIILKLSRTGHETRSAEVLFTDGEIVWMRTQTLVVINESR